MRSSGAVNCRGQSQPHVGSLATHVRVCVYTAANHSATLSACTCVKRYLARPNGSRPGMGRRMSPCTCNGARGHRHLTQLGPQAPSPQCRQDLRRQWCHQPQPAQRAQAMPSQKGPQLRARLRLAIHLQASRRTHRPSQRRRASGQDHWTKSHRKKIRWTASQAYWQSQACHQQPSRPQPPLQDWCRRSRCRPSCLGRSLRCRAPPKRHTCAAMHQLGPQLRTMHWVSPARAFQAPCARNQRSSESSLPLREVCASHGRQ